MIAYVQQWADQVREAVQRLQPSLRPEITLETFERENAQGEICALLATCNCICS